MKKKIISMMLALALSIMAVPMVMAVEPERVVIELESREDITEFRNSPEFDPNTLYRFITPNNMMQRALCPNCGKAQWTGSNYVDENVYRCAQECPYNSFTTDPIAVMRFYYLEKCRSCGYEVVHDEYYFKIYCNAADWTPDYEAWDGQTPEGGYDIHECKSTWWNVPSKYH